MIMENALKIEVVGPARVIILSGQFPSEMFMRAPLCTDRGMKTRHFSTIRLSDYVHINWDESTGFYLFAPVLGGEKKRTSSLIFFTDSPFF